MDRDSLPIPRLDFGEWVVPFPDRGHYVFLPSDSLRHARSEPPTAQESGVWLGRTESGASVLLPLRLEVVRGSVKPVFLAVLHQGDELYFAGHTVVFHEVQHTLLATKSRLVGSKCQQCRKRLAAGDSVVQCPLCGGLYCDDCWKFLDRDRCYSRGCSYSPSDPDKEVTARGDRPV
ncbi:RING finger protein [Kitasatospora purpeofusca]|uniref:RING finger protein n=1 Tax=Kitasatospora purpeofusca TaxID=67352 RepID=UPI0036D0C785